MRTFEGCELSAVELKLHFMRSLSDWLLVTGTFSFSNLLEFLDLCSD